MGYLRETELVQVGNDKQEHYASINTPIYLSTAYRHQKLGLNQTGYDYIRTGNPTREVLEKAIARLEKGDSGFACSSGMSAIQLAFSLFRAGDHIIASRDLYGGSYRLFEWLQAQYDISFTYWDEKNDGEISNFIKDCTKGIFIETPTNPLMRETDLEIVSKVAKKHQLLLIVDNTFYTPCIQRPIESGADLVIHSGTKYLGGHNDLLAGLVVAKGKEVCDRLAFFHNSAGAVLAPFDCWLLIRGLKTLALRMERHERNAKKVASYLQANRYVKQVFYPGKGGMVSFVLEKEEWVMPFLRSLQLFSFAESLGGVESLITYPATQTHADIPEETRIHYGLSNGLLRVSVGIEHEEDLIADLESAFQQCGTPSLV